MYTRVQTPYSIRTKLPSGSPTQLAQSIKHVSGGEVGKRPVRSSTPVSVTSMVCSNCALGFPSSVTAVQSSGHVLQGPSLACVSHAPSLLCQHASVRGTQWSARWWAAGLGQGRNGTTG